MAKYADKRTARTKSTLCKRKQHEDWRTRHKRRFNVAQESASIATAWADENGWKFSVKNNGHHFIFDRPGDDPKIHFAQWWPQTAKLVIKHEWKRGIHCHDIHQVITEIESAA